MCRARWQSPLMPGCRGCAISAFTCPPFTFGLSMAGMYRRDDPSWQKSIHRSGDEALRRRIVTTTNTTHSPLRNGCAAPTLTVHSRVSWLPFSRLQSAKQRTLRAGYWEFNESGAIAPNVGGRPVAPATEQTQLLPPLRGGAGLSSFRGRVTGEPPGSGVVVAAQRSPELVCPAPAFTRLGQCFRADPVSHDT